jgi:hypothetical protein
MHSEGDWKSQQIAGSPVPAERGCSMLLFNLQGYHGQKARVGVYNMKKILLGTMLLALFIVVPFPTMAAVNISVGISLPPPIVFQAPPSVIVMPDANDVYVIPDITADMYFWNGWWWRLWEGRWYRSHYYDRGWGYYSNVPTFYFDVDPGWRGYYRDRNWYGHGWNYERIPYVQLQQNWKGWQNDQHWVRQGTWGVQGYQPRPQQQRQDLRQERQQQYQQRPEIQQQRQQRSPQGQVPQVQQPRATQGQAPQVQQQRAPQGQGQAPKQPPESGQRQQRQEQKSQSQQPQHSKPQEKPEGGR